MNHHRACTAFIPASASALPTLHSCTTSISRCSRRQALHAVALSLVSTLLRPQVAAALNTPGVTDAIASDDFERVHESVKGDTTFADFVALLQKGDVKRVWFFGPFKEYCCFEATDGGLRHVSEGYPVESALSSESPLHLMAKLRDRNIPYYVAPISAKYLRR